jgi:hypothetical protein
MGSPSGGANKLFFRDDMNASIDGIRPQDVFGWKGNGGAPAAALDDDTEDNDLNEDHKLLLQSSLPLLKSRNSAVVLAACSLHYYCGVASIKVSFILCATDVCLHEF